MMEAERKNVKCKSEVMLTRKIILEMHATKGVP